MNRRRLSALLGMMLAAGVLAGCAASDSGSTAGAPARAQEGGGAGSAPDARGPAAAPNPQQPQPDSSQRQVNQPGLDRKLVRTANLELAWPNVGEVANKARDVAIRYEGFAGHEDVRADSATITLHIPSVQFDRALSDLAGLVPAENLRSRSTTAEDVTEQLVDVESRIATQRKSVERVRALMDRAQTVQEIVQTEAEVTRREADLESLEKRRETLTGQVAMSRVTVRVVKSDAPPPADKSGFLAALEAGWQAFLGAGEVVLMVLGALLPFLIALGIPGLFLGRAWLRRRRRLTPAVQPEGSV